MKILMHAFDTETGIPYGQINLQMQQGKNPAWTQKASILSEFGTEQLELIQTSLKTGNPEYARKTEAVITFLNKKYPDRVSTALLAQFSRAHALTSLDRCRSLPGAQRCRGLAEAGWPHKSNPAHPALGRLASLPSGRQQQQHLENLSVDLSKGRALVHPMPQTSLTLCPRWCCHRWIL